MKPILHIINNPDDAQAIETIRIQGKDSAYGVAAVFTAGVPSQLPSMPDVRILSLPLSSEGREYIENPPLCSRGGMGGSFVEVIGYDDLLNLIFSVETISVW